MTKRRPVPGTVWTPLGDMNKQMAVFALDDTPTASFGTADTPIPVMVIRAKLTPLRGNELFQAQCQTRMVTHRLNLVYQGGITGKMYAELGDRTFQFTSVINIDEENRELEIIAIEDVT
jgi:SPP1 family predicted phage head-tail adaptor